MTEIREEAFFCSATDEFVASSSLTISFSSAFIIYFFFG